ncbi:MAG: response regulator [Gammaproteobacteria bacterium]|nr:response regulator [Gammaproteobacteria bacterium]
MILSQAGYTVLTAEDGMLGWELFLSQRDKISAIVCDVVMPNMAGRQLLRLVRELDEHVPFPFVSGYVGGVNPQNFAEHYQVEFLQKPFSAASLQQKVREILDHRVASAPAKKRVLAVDDNDSILHLLELDVVELGHEIVTASSGEAAIDAADQLDFDVIFMDLQMSPVDGVEATQSIRARQNDRPGPVIIGLTAHCTDDEHHRCIDAGMDDVITKPIRYDRLSELLGGNRSDEEDDTAARLRAPVFDLDVSLHLANNRSEVAEEMFAILMSRIEEDQAAIRQAFDDSDMEELAGQVHKLNGAVRYCGVPALMHAVNELETTVKTGSPTEVRDGLAEVDSRIDELIAWHEENPEPFSTRGEVPDVVS